MRFVIVALLPLAALAQAPAVQASAAQPQIAPTVEIQVLATTDLHGNILPWDYYAAAPAARGLAKVATLIRAARTANPNTLLIDVGDTIQGTPLAGLHATRVREGQALGADPMMKAMNELGYAAMTVGNHEFNFGLKVLNKARDEAQFPWLSANTQSSGVTRPFESFIVRTVGGVKIGVFGITTPNIPMWEKPENYAGYRFDSPVETARRVVAELRAQKVDLVIGAVHAGLSSPGGDPTENMAETIARDVPGIDAIYYGHTHQVVTDMRVGNVMLVQARNWGGSLAQSTFTFAKLPDGTWRLVGKKNKLVPVMETTALDPAIAKIAEPYHQAAERWLATRIATAPEALDAAHGHIEDSALVDAIHQVQLHYAKADVSLTALFNPRLKIAAGPVTVRDAAGLYLYENELYAIDGNGAMLKAALENAARFFQTCKDAGCTTGPLLNGRFPGYNFDMAQGVEYEIDLRAPEGQRIKNLRYKGAPLADTQKLRIAVNDYRAGGSGGYTMFKGAPVAWRSHREVRDLIIEYYTEHKMLPAKPDQNWRIVPEAARQTLEQELRRP